MRLRIIMEEKKKLRWKENELAGRRTTPSPLLLPVQRPAFAVFAAQEFEKGDRKIYNHS
jgi:hypothetical protein